MSTRNRRLVTYGKASRSIAKGTPGSISSKHVPLGAVEPTARPETFAQGYGSSVTSPETSNTETNGVSRDAREAAALRDTHVDRPAVSSDDEQPANENPNKRRKPISNGPSQRTRHASTKSISGHSPVSAIGHGSGDIRDVSSSHGPSSNVGAPQGDKLENGNNMFSGRRDISRKRSNSSRSSVAPTSLGNVQSPGTGKLAGDSSSSDAHSVPRTRQVLAYSRKNSSIARSSAQRLTDKTPEKYTQSNPASSDNISTNDGEQVKPNSPRVDTPGRKRLVDSLSAQERPERPPPQPSDIDGDSKAMSSNDPFTTPAPTGQSIRFAASQSSGSKVTYARQRSFLSELGSSDDAGPRDLSELLSSSRMQLQPQVSSATTISSLIDDEESTRASSVRSIHELRRAGRTAHFQATVNSMLEDIEDTSLSMSSRRSALLQLCRKLSDHQFALQFLEHGFDRRLASCISDQLDVTCSYLALCAYALILSNGPPSPDVLLSFWPQVLQLSPALLELEDDVLVMSKQKRYNLPKDGQRGFRDLVSHFRTVFPAYQLHYWLSPQILGLRCIWLTLRGCRDRIDALKRIPGALMERIVEILVRNSVHLGDSLSPESLSILEYTLSILEAHTTLPDILEDCGENPIKAVASLGTLLHSLEEPHDHRLKEIQVLYIRLVLNITNNNTSLCEDFSTPELVRSLVEIVLKYFERVSEMVSAEKKESIDAVILALGTLINLTEETATPRKLILEEMTQSGSLLDRLLSLFSSGFEAVSEADSFVQTHSNVAFGYLSILLCTLSLDESVRARLRRSLCGNGLSRVLATAEEFLQYHRKVEDELRSLGGEQDQVAGFTSRLQGLVERIRRFLDMDVQMLDEPKRDQKSLLCPDLYERISC
ncbi:hypothetical protein DTO217A2_5739 [Paecilomyces variotii]|nr:hypothetical protein DTO217A2_5739 [Paecilomyces variotii]KAJ9371192.1 hypothetical protein DTO282E5_4047 [Paecilomyces variotii]